MNLNQVTVYSKDVKKAAEFYQKLGLLLIVDSIPRYARFEYPDDDSTFSLHETDQTWLWGESHLRDLDNNKIILFHAGKNRNSPPWHVN